MSNTISKTGLAQSLQSGVSVRDPNLSQDLTRAGDLMGAYDEIQSRMTSRLANRIAYGIGSHPWQDSDPYANGWE